MIKANELRIGNLVNIGKEPNILELVDFADMYENNTLEHYQPIPLTEDWLLKIPLEIGEWDSDTEMFYFEKSEFIIEKLGNGHFVFCPYSTCNFLVKLESVHHWQNLYFALTGNELELK